MAFVLFARPVSNLCANLSIRNACWQREGRAYHTFSKQLKFERQQSAQLLSKQTWRPVMGSAGPVLEGDLVAYRRHVESAWKVAAVTLISDDTIILAPVHCRGTDGLGRLEIFVDWHLFNDAITASPDDVLVTALDTDNEMRIIEDRVINPHGEESEDCWRIRPTELMELSLTIRTENTLE